MRNHSVFKILIIVCIIFISILLYLLSLKSNITVIKAKPMIIHLDSSSTQIPKHLQEANSTSPAEYPAKIIVSFVVCDTRFNESLIVVKSALMFSQIPLHFVIITDDLLMPMFDEVLGKWKDELKQKFTFELHKINFPEEHREDWLHLFSKCAAQRLFLPRLMPHIDSLLYVDTDTAFLAAPATLWRRLARFNGTQVAALALEDDNPNVSWYPRFAKHPFYGKYGLNSGVMLMNLTRMREFNWVDYVTPIMLKYRLYIPWGDQDIINIIFHYHPGAVHVLPCSFNFRTEQCAYGAACAAAAAGGVRVLHASRGAARSGRHPAFEAVISSLRAHRLGVDSLASFERRLSAALAAAGGGAGGGTGGGAGGGAGGAAGGSACGAARDALLRGARDLLGLTAPAPDP